MARKFILLIRTENSKVCYRGEGTAKQVKGDVKKLLRKVDPESLEVYPVSGSRFSGGGFLAGLLLGAAGLWLSKKCYEALRKRSEQAGGESTSTQ